MQINNTSGRQLFLERLRVRGRVKNDHANQKKKKFVRNLTNITGGLQGEICKSFCF